jgi:CBS domain-containing protein
MAKLVRDVMTTDPVCLDADQPVSAAAIAMRDRDIGDVIVMNSDAVCGIVTDRDVVVRAVAAGRDPKKTKLSDICSRDLATVKADTTIETAVGMMRDKAVRRLPVMDDGRAVGIVSIGDFATERDPKSALADISTAPPNT